MKAAKLTKPGNIELIETKVPEFINGTDVLVRVKVVGVCGSDLHYFNTGKIGNLVVEYPFTLGHEGGGIVEKIGIMVRTIKPGDRIAIEPSLSCGECEQCKAGRPHTCINNKFLGCPGQLEGNLSEYIVIKEEQCIKLDDSLSYEDAALSEPLSIGLYANKQANYNKGLKIGILGFGPIGMSVMLTSQATTPGKYYVTDKIPERLKMAEEFLAEWTGNPLSIDVVTSIKEKEPELLDVVFECCGQQDALDTAVDIVKPGGKILIVGIPEFDRWNFQADLARRKEITFIHVRRQNNCVEETLQLMQSGKIDASKMVTHHFNLSQTQEAFDLVNHYKDGAMKVMVTI